MQSGYYFLFKLLLSDLLIMLHCIPQVRFKMEEFSVYAYNPVRHIASEWTV